MWLWKAKRTSTATGIRTRVSAMRGRRPSPLDDSGAQTDCMRLPKGPLDGRFCGTDATYPRRPSSCPGAAPTVRYLRLSKVGRMWRNW